MAGAAAELDVDGRSVTVSSPDKVLFAERGETKLDLARYYLTVGEPLLLAMGGRPVLLQRFPNGAGGSSFFQKRIPDTAPEWLRTTIVSTPNGTESRALVIEDLAHVVWAVNLACLGFHVWPSTADRPDGADELRLDLDPQPGTGFAEIREAARELRALLDELGLAGHPKTTGNRGLHVYVRLHPRYDSYQVRAAAVAVARELERRRPDLVTAAWWDEVDRWHPDELTMASVPALLAERGDPWAGIAGDPQPLEPLLAMSERDLASGLLDALSLIHI